MQKYTIFWFFRYFGRHLWTRAGPKKGFLVRGPPFGHTSSVRTSALQVPVFLSVFFLSANADHSKKTKGASWLQDTPFVCMNRTESFPVTNIYLEYDDHLRYTKVLVLHVYNVSTGSKSNGAV